MPGDVARLSSWHPLESDLVPVGENTYRPAKIEAHFSIGGRRTFTVTAAADGAGVKITQVSWNPELYSDTGFDLVAAAAALERATTVEYSGTLIRLGADAPWLFVGDVRRFLAGPAGPAVTGPRRKASLEQTAKLWRAATRKGTPPARAVADALDVSISTAHRYVAAARKAGLIEEKS